jgi:hypothetical protein
MLFMVMTSLLLYAGLLCALIGLIGSFRNRRRWLRVLLIGVALVFLAFLLPVREYRADGERGRIDEFVPVYQFGERHSRRMQVSCERAYAALKQVTASEISLFRLLTWLRRLGRKGPESILNAPDSLPLLDVATRSGFFWLADEPGREGVLGTVVVAPPGGKHPSNPAEFGAVTAPGYAVAAMSFRFMPQTTGTGGGCVVTTETRVRANDPKSRRVFARYWRVIYPGSALIRVMWLRAIQRRAERTRTAAVTG